VSTDLELSYPQQVNIDVLAMVVAMIVIREREVEDKESGGGSGGWVIVWCFVLS